MLSRVKGSTIQRCLQHAITKTGNETFEAMKNESASPEQLGLFEERVNARIRKFINDHLLPRENFAKLVAGRDPAVTARIVHGTLTVTANADLLYINEELKKDI